MTKRRKHAGKKGVDGRKGERRPVREREVG